MSIEPTISIVMLILLLLLFPVCVSFPLSALGDNILKFAFPTAVHSYSDRGVAMVVRILAPQKAGDLAPEVELPAKPWRTRPVLVMRVNMKNEDVVWARSMEGSLSDQGTCMDDEENLYYISLEQNGNESVVRIRSFSRDGTLIANSTLPHPVRTNLNLILSGFACLALHTIVFQAYENKIYHFVVVNATTAKVISITPLQQPGVFLHGAHIMSAADGSACILQLEHFIRSYPYKLLSENWSIHCVRTSSGIEVSQRNLTKIWYLKSGRTIPSIVVATRESWANCQPVYVAYRSNNGVRTEEGSVLNQVTLRKLCIDSLKDTPWSPGGHPHFRYISLTDPAEGISVTNLVSIPKIGGIAMLIVPPRTYSSAGNISISGQTTTLLGTTIPFSVSASEKWLFVYGPTKSPKVFPIPWENNDAKGYSLPMGYDSFYFQSIASPKNNRNIVVYGTLVVHKRGVTIQRSQLYSYTIRV